VIENQLGKGDHDHLGKLITYLTDIEARVAIWNVSDPRPEHITAINWLHQSPDTDYFLLKRESVRICEPLPAPLMTLIVEPSEEVREAGAARKPITERHTLYRRSGPDFSATP
jgi:hypothetical protein